MEPHIMRHSLRGRSTYLGAAALFVAGAVLAGCAIGGKNPAAGDPRFAMGDEAAVLRARADSIRYPYTVADVEFMSGMIHHHAQAITISRWAVSHDAGAAVQRLTARIINAQSDEITLMQTWLRDRLQEVPVVDSLGVVTMSGGMSHSMSHDMSGGMSQSMSGAMGAGSGVNALGQMSMPGMLSAAQMSELDAARGTDFDTLFLRYMIQHHRGAVEMVRTLFASPGAGQDETVFKFANDVEVDQGTEIRRMMTMMLEAGVVPPAH